MRKIGLALVIFGISQAGWAHSLYKNSPKDLAKAFGVSESLAQEAQAQDLDEILTWSLLLMSSRCRCSVNELMMRRESKSWGEVAESAGWGWEALMDAIMEKSRKAGLKAAAPDEHQLQRSASNKSKRYKARSRRDEARP